MADAALLIAENILRAIKAFVPRRFIFPQSYLDACRSRQSRCFHHFRQLIFYAYAPKMRRSYAAVGMTLSFEGEGDKDRRSTAQLHRTCRRETMISRRPRRQHSKQIRHHHSRRFPQYEYSGYLILVLLLIDDISHISAREPRL